jgi:hypothetical protein
VQKEYDLYAKFGRRDKDVPFFTTFALSPKREDLDAATEPSQNTPETQKADESNHFKIITNDFCDIIRKFNTTIKAVIAMSAVAKGVHLETEVLDFFTKNGDRIEDGADKVIFGLLQHHYEALSKKLNKLDALYSGLAAMPELFVLGLISAYDAFLTELIKAMFRTKPDLLASTERTLTFSELAKMGSIEAAQEFIIEKEVESVIRQSHADHFSWLEKKLGIPFKKDLKIWPKFIELCERRNLLTHTGGIISSQYLQVCTMHSVDVSGLSVS